MPVLTYTLFDALKRMYPPWKVLSTVAKDNPAWTMAQKATDGGGDHYTFGIEYALPNRSATFAVAQARASRTRHKLVLLDFGDDFGIVQVEQKLIEGAQGGGPGGEKALVDAMKSQTEGILTQLNNSLGRQMFGDGSGAIGAIFGVPGASPLLTLLNPSDVVNFYQGQDIVFALNTGAALRAGGARLTVLRVNELAGVLTMNANLNTIGGLANGDLLFNEGDYVTAADRLLMRGLDAWVPRVNPVPGALFWGMDRADDITALAGYRFTDAGPFAGFSAEEAIRLVASFLGRGGGSANTCFASHLLTDQIINAVGSKESFQKIVPIKDASGKSIAELGFDGVKLRTTAGIIEVFPDRSCPDKTIFVGDIEKLHVVSIGEAPHWITDPGNKNTARTMDTAAAVECRLVAWPQMAIRRPRSWGRFDWT